MSARRRIFHLIPDLDYGSAARQLTLLAPGLAANGHEQSVGILGGDGPLCVPLRNAGVKLTFLGSRWRRLIDPNAWIHLRQLLRRMQPEIIHVWRRPALWSLVSVGGWRPARLVAGQCRAPRRPFSLAGAFEELILRRADAVFVHDEAEAREMVHSGVARERIIEVAPGVELPPSAEDRAAFCRSLSLPSNSRFIVGIGPLESHKGFLDAIWAFDILRFIYPDLRLLLVGQGSSEPELRRFTRSVQVNSYVQFLGTAPQVSQVLAHAEVVWVPSRRAAGVNAVLEAMAAGRPVVASRLVPLSSLVVEDETGLLFPPQDKAALARQTRVLLEDAALRSRMGEAARQRATTRYAVPALVSRTVVAYETVLNR